MRRHTTINLDSDLVTEAGATLGTRGTTATIHAALREVIARKRRRMLAQFDFGGLTPDYLAQMRVNREFGSFDEKPRK